MDVYKVGIMTGVAWVESPTAKAAALFYGLRTRGNAELMTAVYERNGKPVEGDDGLPWGRFIQSDNEEELARELEAVKPDLERCRLIPSPKALEIARLFLKGVAKDTLEDGAWKIDTILDGEEGEA